MKTQKKKLEELCRALQTDRKKIPSESGTTPVIEPGDKTESEPEKEKPKEG